MKILYLAPDPVPAPKGAAVRIEATLEALRSLGHSVEAFLPPSADGTASGNFLERMLEHRRAAAAWLAGRRADLVQFRSIWEGIPAARWARQAGARVAFEAHGFPSIELPYHHPGLPSHPHVLEKLIAEEAELLAASDFVLTHSRTGARYLLMRGVAKERISILPNPVDTALFLPPPSPPADASPLRLVYVGTLSPWQGLGTLLEALVPFRRGAGVALRLVGPAKGLWRGHLRARMRALRVHHLVALEGAMTQAELAPSLQESHVCVAPLPADARNVVQGCCPIKILEYMAAGRPILSTRVPPVEEVLEHGVTGHLVEPGSPAALARGLRWMLSHPAEREALGAKARSAAVERWGFERFREAVAAVLDRVQAGEVPAAGAGRGET